MKVEEQKSTTDRVFMDRQSHLQLAIVRILKSRKTLKHSELVHETVAQIKDRFKVEVSEIKKVRESRVRLMWPPLVIILTSHWLVRPSTR